MDEPAFTEPASEVLARAREAGHRPSTAQIARWHRAGLLRRPRQRPLGRGKGTETVYAFGTGDQLVALCEIHFREKVRRLADIGWRLWWRGFTVDDEYWRPELKAAAANCDHAINALTEPIDADETDERDLTDDALDQIDALSERRSKNRLFRQLRKRVGRKSLPTFVRLALLTAVGAFNGFNDPSRATHEKDVQIDKDVLARGFAINRAQKNAFPNVNYSLEGNVDEVSGALAEISQARKSTFTKVLRDIPDGDLFQARNELWHLILKITAIGHVLEQSSGKRSAWDRIIRKIALTTDTNLQAIVFLLWLVVRQIPSMQQGILAFLRPEPAHLDADDASVVSDF